MLTLGAASVGTCAMTIPAGAEPAANVAIVGDSISAMTSREYQIDLRADHLLIDAVGGTRIADHLSTLEALAPRTWDVVIELGTNDAAERPLDSTWTTPWDEQESAVVSQPCVVFVTVDPKLGAIAQGIDAAIANAVASHSNFHVVDWGDIEWQHQRWMRSDNIHPTTDGSAELAHLVHDELATYCGAPRAR